MGKRDYSYYLDRLEREHPAIYADYKAGRFPSPRSALIAAGSIRPPSPLTVLKRAWRKASRAERSEFLAWATGSTRPAGRRSSSRKATTPIVDAERRLLPAAKAQIAAIMSSRRMTMGAVMKEMGFDPLDTSPASAVIRGYRLKDKLIVALERWIEDNRAHW